jgi:hypothetical protein
MDSRKLQKISQFLSDGEKRRDLDWRDVHILKAWSWTTLLSYNAGVKKYMKFKEQTKEKIKLPIEHEDIERFCFWAGRTSYDSTSPINAKTLVKYLYAIQAWHQFHNARQPNISTNRIRLILKSCAKEDEAATHKKEKKPILLPHLLRLVNGLGEGEEERAIADVLIISFWGMCRLKEVTYENDCGKLNIMASILTSDVTLGSSYSRASIKIRGAKSENQEKFNWSNCSL